MTHSASGKTGIHKTHAHGASAETGERKADIYELAHKAGEKARQLVDEAGAEFSDQAGTVAEAIRRKPLQAGAIMAGVGFLLGLFLRRR